MALLGGIYTVNALARANGVRTVVPGEEPNHHIGGMKLDFPDVSGMFYGEGLRKVTQVSDWHCWKCNLEYSSRGRYEE